MSTRDHKAKLIDEQHQEVLKMAKRHGRELEKLMNEQSAQIEALSTKHAKQMAELEAGRSPKAVDEGLSQAMTYEVYLICSSILAKFNEAKQHDPELKWFSLQDTFDAEAGNTELNALLYQSGKSRTAAYKAAASALRGLGLHVGRRLYLGGKVCRPVWDDATQEQAFFMRRDQLAPATNPRGVFLSYDNSSKWELPK